MRTTVTIIGVALATIGGAYAGTVVPVDLSQKPVGVCTGANCTVSSTSTGTFENYTFGTVYPTNPAGAPNTNATNTSFGPTPFIIDSAANAATGSNANSIYVSPTTGGNHTATLLVDLGTCAGAGTSNAGPGGECGIFDADDIYTMIEAGGSWGVSGQNVTVTVEGVNSSDVYSTDVFTLLPGVDYRTYSSSVTGADCTAADSNDTGNTSCVGVDNTASISGTDPNNPNIKIYNNVYGAQSQSGTTYYIDTQALSLGTLFQGGYVDSVLIQYNGPTSGNRQITFSALSVDTTASQQSPVPEPGTLATLGLGLGLIGFRTIRNQRTKKAAVAE